MIHLAVALSVGTITWVAFALVRMSLQSVRSVRMRLYF